jgi:heme/copper-type cytochrome/quinol oxidase subunit 3
MQSSSYLTREEQAEKRRRQAERAAAIRLKNNKLGITIFQFTWILAFVCLIVVYWQMGHTPGWHPTPEQKPGLLLPTAATIALLASTWQARSAVATIKSEGKPKNDQVQLFQKQWLMAIGLGAVFFVIMVQQLFALPADSDVTRYVQIFRVMIGYHAVHAIIIGLMMVQVYRFSLLGNYHAGNNWSVEAAARLWYFVTAAWLMFFVVLYLI